MRINEKNYVDKAERVISGLIEDAKMKGRGRINIVTTSKLRNLLAMTADIYNQVLLYPSDVYKRQAINIYGQQDLKIFESGVAYFK